jgi:hypothetical protein
MADARLPTGSEEDLTGSGNLSMRASLLASTRLGDFAPHVNVGYAARGGRNDAILAAGGFDQPLSDWATIAVDAITEWQVGESSLQLPGDVKYEFPVTRTISPTNIPNIKDHRIYGSFGMKFRTPGGPILVANALMPLRRAASVAVHLDAGARRELQVRGRGRSRVRFQGWRVVRMKAA